MALDLTYRCGFRCAFCFVKNNRLLAPGRRELGAAGFRKLIRSFSGRPVKFYITGGEPCLNKDLPGIVRAIKAGGHKCLITTNAYALNTKLLRGLAAADELVISLHGSPAMHDSTAGVKGAFGRAAAAVAALRKLPEPRPRVTLWCTISAANHARLPETYKAMAALRPDNIAFNHLEYVSERDFRDTRRLLAGQLGAEPAFRPSEHLLRGISPGKIALGAVEVRRLSGGSAKFYPDLDLEGIRAWYNPRSQFKRHGFCAGQWRAAWVSPYGDLLTCQPLAHLTQKAPLKDLAAAYRGEGYAAFRRLLIRCGGFLPACRRCGREPYHPTRPRAGL